MDCLKPNILLKVKKMNANSLSREREFSETKKKLAAMEKLNRALQKERAELNKKLEEKA